jgi:hypothetical protein
VKDLPMLGPEYEDLGLCPCGKKIGANGPAGHVIHELPACKAFMKLDPVQFLAYVRRSRGVTEN